MTEVIDEGPRITRLPHQSRYPFIGITINVGKYKCGTHPYPIRTGSAGIRWHNHHRKRKELTVELKRKNHYRCQKCKVSKKHLGIHHTLPLKVMAPELYFDKRFLQLLCRLCHNEVHMLRGWQLTILQPTIRVRYRLKDLAWMGSTIGPLPWVERLTVKE